MRKGECRIIMAIQMKAIIGSTSKGSFNRKIVEFMKERYKDRLEITALSIKELEMYCVDDEGNPSENVRSFKQEVNGADAVLFAVPEYNFSIPGALKNALDWLSRGGDYVIKEKPTLILGASMGVLGSVRAQLHLREILANPNLAPAILPGNEVYIGSIHQKLNEAGEITDEGTLAFLDLVVNNFVEFYEQQQKLKA